MPTAVFSTDVVAGPVRDLRALVAFRRSTLSRGSRRRLTAGLVTVAVATLTAIVLPAFLPELTGVDRRADLMLIVPSLYLGFLALAVLSAGASAGGRELVPRDQAVAWPISPAADHLGALLLAPLNISWLLQAWLLLGITSYVEGPRGLVLGWLPVLLWILAATATAQLVAWLLEFVRRGPAGLLVVRLVGVAAAAALAALILTHTLAAVLDHSPTVWILLGSFAAQGGDWARFGLVGGALLLLVTAAVVAGAFGARWATGRAPRDEHRMETRAFAARSTPSGDFVMLVRIDRASVWRSVPLRRGITVLVLLPGLVALAGHLEWSTLLVLPGLVGSGGALLFGVNAFCLDARGVLWRESLPAAPSIVLAARAYVLAEVLLGGATVTLLLALLRAHPPRPVDLVALVCTTLVVVGQVVGASLRWSVRSPYAVDLRSARATPAPPVAMVGYSARLALSTTVTGLLFSAVASVGITPVLMLAIAFGSVTALRVRRTSQQWLDPVIRARVAVTVAG